MKELLNLQVFKNKEKVKINLNDNILFIDFFVKEMQEIKKKVQTNYKSFDT